MSLFIGSALALVFMAALIGVGRFVLWALWQIRQEDEYMRKREEWYRSVNGKHQ